MKQEFKTTELRQTAEAIRDAVLAKSITPDMVGGTMLALVNASGEVIEALGNLESERVTVKVQAYDGQSRVDVTGAKVYLDQFSIGGVPTVSVPRQEYEVDENGEVTFEVLKGYQYAVFSKLDGMGASFQYVYEASQKERLIDLWNFPIGVYMVGYAAYGRNDEDDNYVCRCVPVITGNFISNTYESQLFGWDIQEDESMEDSYNMGILVSTSDTSFAIAQYSRPEDYMAWSGKSDYGRKVPTMPIIDPWVEDYDAMVELARADFDGNINTRKILLSCNNPVAAKSAVDINEWSYAQHYLPSAGQLYLIYLNKQAINALMTEANEDGYEFTLIDNNYYWSSTQANEWCAWYVNMLNGNTYGSLRYDDSCVRAVSAFHFIY